MPKVVATKDFKFAIDSSADDRTLDKEIMIKRIVFVEDISGVPVSFLDLQVIREAKKRKRCSNCQASRIPLAAVQSILQHV